MRGENRTVDNKRMSELRLPPDQNATKTAT